MVKNAKGTTPDERRGDMIQRVTETIWTTDGRVQCPVCAQGMQQSGKYAWLCKTGICPINCLEFNKRIHNYHDR